MINVPVRRLDSLTQIRAFAALFVFVYHINHNTQWLPHKELFSVGYVGVSLFFVLSGFVLTWSYEPSMKPKTYYIRRGARIYPLHLFFLFLALLLPVISYSRNILSLFPNILLIQSWIPDWGYVFSYNSVSWSLSCEVFFYALTPFILKYLYSSTGKRNPLVSLLTVSLCIVFASTMLSVQSNYVDVLTYAHPIARLPEFILGVATAYIVRQLMENSGAGDITRFKSLALIMGAGLVSLLIVYILSNLQLNQTMTSYICTPSFALLIAMCAFNDVKRSQGNKFSKKPIFHKILVKAGEISFAFYLAHELVIVNLEWVASLSQWQLSGMVLACLALILSALIAAMAHVLIEKPAHRAIVLHTGK
ncbi:acyltransferase [Rothia terrae]|uniref:acyltransferase family protein n=1 Tax=Rothia terrae TaxID=396015 RepID=UPI001446E2AB|nr:acyltransferase [Rothia terrae]